MVFFHRILIVEVINSFGSIISFLISVILFRSSKHRSAFARAVKCHCHTGGGLVKSRLAKLNDLVKKCGGQVSETLQG